MPYNSDMAIPPNQNQLNRDQSLHNWQLLRELQVAGYKGMLDFGLQAIRSVQILNAAALAGIVALVNAGQISGGSAKPIMALFGLGLLCSMFASAMAYLAQLNFSDAGGMMDISNQHPYVHYTDHAASIDNKGRHYRAATAGLIAASVFFLFLGGFIAIKDMTFG